MKNNLFTNNFFKIIAVVTMLLDHFGYYFYPFINNNIYLALRIIGRFSMPIFLYFIVYGFFKTKNFNKYLFRVFLVGVITQIFIFMIAFLNFKFVPNYNIEVYKHLNILFNFTILLITMKYIDIFKDHKFLSSFGIFINILLLTIFNFDYGFIILILGLIYYFSFKYNLKKKIYIPLIIFYIIIFSLTLNLLHIFMIITVLLLVLHNGKIGKNINKHLYYYIFPIQHILFYIFALIFNLNY